MKIVALPALACSTFENVAGVMPVATTSEIARVPAAMLCNL